jgi:hypothetical protein
MMRFTKLLVLDRALADLHLFGFEIYQELSI